MNLEKQLWNEARAFLSNTRRNESPLEPRQSNLESLVFSLTGNFLGPGFEGKLEAITNLEKLLCKERKKSRLQRNDYSFNRHIALHQCKKRLEAETF